MSNLPGFSEIHVLYFEQMMQVLCWVSSWGRVEEQMLSYSQEFLGLESLTEKILSLTRSENLLLPLHPTFFLMSQESTAGKADIRKA